MAEQRYFWIQLKRDFFKRHDIRIVESMPNGKDYILFYLKLLCESVDHEGNLRFSETIPYNEQMLSTITDTNIDVVRSAIKVFEQLDMMNLLDDGTYFMKEVKHMLGSESKWAQYKRNEREKAKLESNDMPKLDDVQKCPIDIDKEKDKDIKKEIHKESDKATEEDFSMFWELYPRKVNKEEAKKSFLKTKEKEFDLILYALNRFKQTEWKSHLMNKDEIQYIPHASTWLNQARYKDFEDEFINHTPIQEPQQFNNTSFNAEEFAEHNISVNIKSKSLRRMQQEKFIADVGLEKAKEMMPSLFSDYEG